MLVCDGLITALAIFSRLVCVRCSDWTRWQTMLDVGIKYFHNCTFPPKESHTITRCQVSATNNSEVTIHQLTPGVLCSSTCKKGYVWKSGDVQVRCESKDRFVSYDGNIEYNWRYLEGTPMECYRPKKPLPANTCETKSLLRAERYRLDRYERRYRWLYPSECNQVLVKKGTYCFMKCQSQGTANRQGHHYVLRYGKALAAVCAADHRWEPLEKELGFTAFACRQLGVDESASLTPVDGTPEHNTDWLVNIIHTDSPTDLDKREYTNVLSTSHTEPHHSFNKPEWLIEQVLPVHTNNLQAATDEVTRNEGNLKKLLDDAESLMISVPTFYWVLSLTSILVLLIIVISALCYMRYRRNRHYAIVNTEGEQLVPAKLVQRGDDYENTNENNLSGRKLGKRKYSKLIPLEKIQLTTKEVDALYMNCRDYQTLLNNNPAMLPRENNSSHRTKQKHQTAQPPVCLQQNMSKHVAEKHQEILNTKQKYPKVEGHHCAPASDCHSSTTEHSRGSSEFRKGRCVCSPHCVSKGNRHEGKQNDFCKGLRQNIPEHKQHQNKRERRLVKCDQRQTISCKSNRIPRRFRLPSADNSSLTNSYIDH